MQGDGQDSTMIWSTGKRGCEDAVAAAATSAFSNDATLECFQAASRMVNGLNADHLRSVA
jgi:hypothetical protein